MQLKKLAPFLFIAPMITLVAVLLYEFLPSKRYELINDTVTTYLVSDLDNRGNSEATWQDKKSNSWHCALKEGFAFPYCGIEILLSRDHTNGLDFSIYNSIELEYEYKGPAKALQIYIRNQNPLYSKPGTEELNKHHAVDVSTLGKSMPVTIELSTFNVEEWWVTSNNIAPDDANVEMTNVTSLGLGINNSPTPTEHDVKLIHATLKGEYIARANWYLGILSVWVAVLFAIGLFWLYQQIKRAQKNALLAAELAAYNEQIKKLPVTDTETQHIDALTGLCDRFLLTKEAEPILEKITHETPASLILISINEFGRLARSGKDLAERVIVDSAETIKRHSHRRFIVSRWDQSEFLILCPNLMGASAYQVSEKIRRDFIYLEQSEGLKTISIRATVLEMHSGISFTEHLQILNNAMNDAKDMGITTTYLAG